MKKILIVLLCIISFAFTTKDEIIVKKGSITIVKFMYLNDYPMAINMKTFWEFPEEHAQFTLPLGRKTFLDEIKTLPKNDCEKFGSLNYAFIIRKEGKVNDTVYADTSLKTWIFKMNKTTECHYDDNGTYSEFLRKNYRFFKDCW